MSSRVACRERTTIVTLCSPRIASSEPTPPPAHGVLRSSSLPTSSNHRPDGSSTRIAASPNGVSTSRGSTPASRSRRRQKPSDEAGTENDVVAICPAPLTPTRHAVAPVRKGRPDRAWRSALRAVIEVVHVVVVEVDRLLDQPQPEHARGRNRGRPERRQPSPSRGAVRESCVGSWDHGCPCRCVQASKSNVPSAAVRMSWHRRRCSAVGSVPSTNAVNWRISADDGSRARLSRK